MRIYLVTFNFFAKNMIREVLIMANGKTLVYQLWPISWGGIKAMTLFLPRIAALGADYVWFSPIYTSPWKNHGYDVADYYTVDSRLGTMEDVDEFIRTAHALGLKVITDIVIDSTSVKHTWFLTEPHRYVWSKNRQPERISYMDQSLAWTPYSDKFYLSLSHPEQADLNWFQGGVLNRALVESFKSIMHFWLYKHDIDGFRINSVQSLNQSTFQGDVRFNDSLIGKRAVQAVDELSNLYGGKTPFLMMDVIDPHYSKVTNYYAEETDVEFITNRALKSSIGHGGLHEDDRAHAIDSLKKKISKQVKCSKFMLDLESHEAQRFTSRSGLSGEEVLELMFQPKVQAICLYQGQELGLKNPTEQELPFLEMLNLDARAAAYMEKQAVSPESIRQNARANARVPIPLDEYARQEESENSTLAFAKNIIREWKKN